MRSGPASLHGRSTRLFIDILSSWASLISPKVDMGDRSLAAKEGPQTIKNTAKQGRDQTFGKQPRQVTTEVSVSYDGSFESFILFHAELLYLLQLLLC